MEPLREGWRHTMVWVPVGRSRTIIVLVYGTDPNRGEPCVLYVVKVLPNAVPGSTTPIGDEKELDEGRKRRGTMSGPLVGKRLGLHQLGGHNGP